MQRLALLAAAATSIACFDVPVTSGEIACSEESTCPTGLDCIGGLCVTPGTTVPGKDGGGFDADPMAPDSSIVDGAPEPDAMGPLGAFATPTVISAIDAATQLEDDPSVTVDELELFYNRNNQEIYVSKRNTTGDAWGTPTHVSALGDGEEPFILPNGLVIYFVSPRLGNGTYDIFRSTRANRNAAWTTPAVVGSPISLAVGSDERGPCVTSDELVIIFASDRASNGVYHLYRSKRASIGDAWPTPTAISGIIGADGIELECWVSDDEKDLYFGSNRSGGTGPVNIWHAVGDGDGGYGSVSEVSELSTSGATTADPFLMGDQKTIYFAKQLSGQDGDINVAER